ncbi:unnamed protein product [Lampetra fluviatilis]
MRAVRAGSDRRLDELLALGRAAIALQRRQGEAQERLLGLLEEVAGALVPGRGAR